MDMARGVASATLYYSPGLREWLVDHSWENPEFGMTEDWGRCDTYSAAIFRATAREVLEQSFAEFPTRHARRTPDALTLSPEARKRLDKTHLQLGVDQYEYPSGAGYWLISPMSPVGRGYRGYQCMPEDLIRIPTPVDQAALLDALDRACSFLLSKRSKTNTGRKRRSSAE